LADPWGKSSAVGGINAPARKTIDISAQLHAANPLTVVPRAIRCNVAGDIACRFAGDSADRTVTLLAGIDYPYMLSHVRIAGTTATGIIGLL
jgi:hypothetical protein